MSGPCPRCQGKGIVVDPIGSTATATVCQCSIRCEVCRGARFIITRDAARREVTQRCACENRRLRVRIYNEARVLHRVQEFRSWRRFPISIFALGLNVFRTETGVSLQVDGERVVSPDETVYSVGVYNSPCYARGKVVLPGADPSDARVDAVVHRTRRGYWRAIRHGIEAGVSDASGSARYGCTTLRLETSRPVQFDGESAPGGIFECRVEDAAIRVLVPPTPVPAED